ncbi:hypothetical protein GCK72_020868 [Caenorhabditis remanei]|uniref:Seven TM Receptor n=1 Tax=Caenorhabditis remanei TaxID=31234 RepID=A0A6A5GGG4_CAERE|nr:hypothetical protein GCK72_020868 [Caenorhabditis remanei]KAF1754308.1 hypothetical protein GCK72_020868 [Caenorhabditis remanei]
MFGSGFYPNLHLYNNGLVYFSLSHPYGFSNEVLEMILPFYAAVYSVTLSLLAIQFIYRYWALFSLSYLTLFKGWKSFIWVAYCFFFGAVWFLADYFLLKIDDTTEKYFHEEMLIRYGVTSKEIPIMTFLVYDPNDGSIRGISVFNSFLLSGAMGFQYGAMMYCGWNMNSKMEKQISCLSAALKRHHRQLFRTLVFQITTPTIFLFFPLILVVYLPYFQLELSFPAGATICAFNFYPAMDSIIVMIIVTEYRVVARKMLNVLLRKSMVVFRGKDIGAAQTSGQIQMATIGVVS